MTTNPPSLLHLEKSLTTPGQAISMRKVKYHVAVTVDGFIARHDGSFDYFPEHGDHIADYLEALESYGAVLMGRKTYEVGLKAGITDPYPHMKSFVFSRTLKKSPNPRVEIVAGNPATFVRQLKEQSGKDIYMCGGGNLAAQLFRQGLIEELILKVNPVVLGWGTPLIASLGKHIDLELLDTKVYTSGVVRLAYRVKV
jgi:dihydrofolate reductase